MKELIDMKEDKRREQYRRIQEFKRKKHEEKSILKKRRLEEGKSGGKVESFDNVKEVYKDRSNVEQGEIGLEGRSGQSLVNHNEKTRLSMKEEEHALVERSIQ